MPFDGASYETVARRMLALFDGGRRWAQCNYYSYGRFCLAGAYTAVTRDLVGKHLDGDDMLIAVMRAVTPLMEKEPSYRMLQRATAGRSVEGFNDSCEREFAEIVAALERMHAMELRALTKGAAKPVKRQQKELVDAV